MGNCHSCQSKWNACIKPCSGCCACDRGDAYEVTPKPGPPEETELKPLPPQPPSPSNNNVVPIPLPKPPSDDVDDNETLQVKGVDWLIAVNGRAHHTNEYELMERGDESVLVIRRGQAFELGLQLNRDFNAQSDALSLVFTVPDAKHPSPHQGTVVTVPVLPPDNKPTLPQWSAAITSSEHCSVRLSVCTPANAIVGQWKLELDTKLQTEEKALCYTAKSPIYILYNAWCPEDQVYLADEKCKQEYVLNDSGLIWRGSHNRLRPCVWNFAQFEKDVLDCSLYLVSQVGKLTVAGRADPIRTTRVLSAAVNSSDDNGLLMGNWSDDYNGGTAPTKWIGSLKILQEYWETKRPVKFGQCWVFSGVTTTVCRALGIPCRSVTNFASAHDTEGSLTIDCFVDAEGKTLEELNSDSIWNFHVWNEVWLKRPDLNSPDQTSPEPRDYSGWQAIDATPQEESDGLYRCGPVSVKAVKNGEVLKPFDTAFQFAEVNADRVYWLYNGPDKPMKLMSKRTDDIGLNISTKAVGTNEREDITHSYKHSERSEDERAAVLRALRQCEHMYSRYYLNEEFEEIHFDFQLKDDIVIGSPFSVVVGVTNKSRTTEHSINVVLRVDTVLYTGRLKSLVKKETFEKTLQPGQSDHIALVVSYKEYASALSDQCAFNIACMASVLDTNTNFEYFAQDDFRVRKPDIKIETVNQVCLGDEFDVTVSFTNPLPVTLTKGKFIIDGPGLGEALKVQLTNAVQSGQLAQAKVKMTALKAGQKSIGAKFYSKELTDVDGHANITVTSPVGSAANEIAVPEVEIV